jgi:hypothetical protein
VLIFHPGWIFGEGIIPSSRSATRRHSSRDGRAVIAIDEVEKGSHARLGSGPFSSSTGVRWHNAPSSTPAKKASLLHKEQLAGDPRWGIRVQPGGTRP